MRRVKNPNAAKSAVTSTLEKPGGCLANVTWDPSFDDAAELYRRNTRRLLKEAGLSYEHIEISTKEIEPHNFIANVIWNPEFDELATQYRKNLKAVLQAQGLPIDFLEARNENSLRIMKNLPITQGGAVVGRRKSQRSNTVQKENPPSGGTPCH